MGYPPIAEMSLPDIVRELNNSCTRTERWALRPVLNGDDIKFSVVGTVYPFNPKTGNRRARGKVVFYGLSSRDARNLRIGLEAMRDAQESMR
jgi:hypothetical protein